MVHLKTRPSSACLSMTPNGQAGTQYPQPLQTSSCTTTVPNSLRNSAPVGHTSRQAACVQCLQTSEDISQRTPLPWSPSPVDGSVGCSTNATWRQVSALSRTVLSYDMPVKFSPSSGTAFHSLHATSHALQPMQTLVSVKKPTRGVGRGTAATSHLLALVVAFVHAGHLGDPGPPTKPNHKCQPVRPTWT